MSIVAPENGSTQDVQRNVEFVNRPRGLVFQSNITLKLLCQAIDETRPKTVPRRLLDRRPPFSVHVSLNRCVFSSTADVMSTRPVALDNAPCLAAFVHSSLSDILMGRIASRLMSMSVS